LRWIKAEKIFIVEDDVYLQFFYEKILTLNGFEVVGTANNGEEAISMFKSFAEKPKVILMDYNMPFMNGIEASKEIMKINSNTKIIFTSADHNIKEDALSIEAFCFRDKPITVKDLINDINRAIESYNSSIIS